MFFPLVILGGALLSEIVVILLIAAVLFVIFKLGGTIINFIIGLVINSVLGLIALYVFDTFLGMGLPLIPQLIIPIAIFGLPAVGTLVLLKLLGVAISAG